MISSKQSGCRRLTRSVMPCDSSWNTAVVAQRFSKSLVGLSSNGISVISNGASPAAWRARLMIFTAQSMMVRVRNPRKSNLTRPTASTSSLSNCVAVPSPPDSQDSGVESVSAAGVAHHRLGRHRAVGDDLRHALAAIALHYVIDHAVAAFHAEVDVEVGHGDALRVQESLE